MIHPKTLLRVVAAGVLALSSHAFAQDDDAALRAYYGANGLLNRGLYELAVDEYRMFLTDHPEHEKSVVARYGLGVSLFRLQRYEEAAVELRMLHERGETTYRPEVATVLGQSYLALGHHAEAASALNTVLEEYGTHDLADDAAALQAEALHRAGEHEAVERPVRVLVTRAPDSPLRERAELFAGLSEMALERYRPAAQRFGAMLRRYPDGKHAPQVELLLAQAQQRSGDDKAAAPSYRAVLARGAAAHQAEARYGLAAILQRQGDAREAGALLDRLLAEQGNHALSPSALQLRGRVHFDLGAYDDAAACFEPLLDRAGPERDDARYWLAKCDLRRDDPGRAALRLASLERDFPDSPLADEAAYDRAVALVRDDEPEDAVAALAHFRDEWPDHALAPEATQLEATLLHQLGDYDASLKRCRAFLRQHGDHERAPSVEFLRAENLYFTNADDSAAEAYARFLTEHPSAPEADDSTFRLGMVLHRLDRDAEATEVLEQVVTGTRAPAEFHAALLALGDLRFGDERWDDAIALLGSYLDGPADGNEAVPGADDAIMKVALAHHRLDQHEKALDGYEHILSDFPESPHRMQAMFERGQALVALERTDDAEVAFEAVLAEGETRFTAHALNHLGAIAIESGRYDEAAARYGALAARDDAGGLGMEALYQQGQAQFSERRYAEAAATLGALLEAAPEFRDAARAGAQRAIALARSADAATALAAIADVESRFMHELDAELRSAMLYDKAWCLRESADDEAAATAYRAILAETEPTALRANATLELADLERAAGALDAASALLESLVADADGAQHEDALYRLGSIAYSREDYRTAATHLTSFVRSYPQSDVASSANLLAGESLYRRGAFEDAIPYLERAAETDPVQEARINGPALLRLGECRAALQQWRMSAQAFETYLRLHPDSELWFQARFGIGWALENQSRHDDAMTSYREVVDRHQGRTAARAQFQIGECLFAQRQFDEAVRALLKVDILYAYPEWSAAALHEAGKCFVELRDPATARRHFAQVIEEHPDSEWATLAQRELSRLDRDRIPGQ